MVDVTIGGFTLIGIRLETKTSNAAGQSSIDCGMLWQEFEKGNFIERIPNRLSSDIYAVYFDYECDHTKPFSYFIGCRARPETETPKGMASLIVPDHYYTKVIAKGKMPDCVANAWKGIWNSEIARRYNYDFEIYGERSKDWSNAEVEIFVSSEQRPSED